MGFILVCTYIFLSFVRILELYPEIALLRIMFYLGLICLLVTFGTWASTRAKNRPSLRQVQIWLTVLFFVMAVFGWVRIGWWDEVFESINSLQIILGAFLMLVMNLTSLPKMKTLVSVFLLACVVMTIQGVASYYYNWQREIFVLEWRPPEDEPDAQPDPEEPPMTPRMRNMGFLSDPNDLAQTLAICLPFLGLAWKKGRHFVNWCVLVPVGGLLGFGIFLTHSRGGMVAVGVMFLMALRERIGKVKATILTSLMVMALLAFNITGGRAMRDESSDARIEAWASGMIMLRSAPLLGVGYRNFTEIHRGLTAHNSFVLCFAEMGLLGYFVWMSLLTTSYIELGRLAQFPGSEPDDEDIRRWARAIRLAMTTFLAAAFFLSRTFVLTLYMLVAFAVALEDIVRRKYPQYRPKRINVWAKQTVAWQAATIFLVWLAIKANGAG
jgi:putative inorganic carbon (hco3(-)) transporter